MQSAGRIGGFHPLERVSTGHAKQALKREAMNAHRDIKRQQLREIIFSGLSPQEEKRETILLYYFFDMSETEISRLCNIPRTTVKYRRKGA